MISLKTVRLSGKLLCADSRCKWYLSLSLCVYIHHFLVFFPQAHFEILL